MRIELRSSAEKRGGRTGHVSSFEAKRPSSSSTLSAAGRRFSHLSG